MNKCFPNEWEKTNIIPVHDKVTNKKSKITELCHSKFLRKSSLNLSANI